MDPELGVDSSSSNKRTMAADCSTWDLPDLPARRCSMLLSLVVSLLYHSTLQSGQYIELIVKVAKQH